MIRVAAIVIALAGVAQGEPKPDPPPDQAAADARDANLESTATRRGMTFDAAFGGGLTVGIGMRDSVGRGGSVSFRIGRVATPRTVITFELAITPTLHRATGAAQSTNVDVDFLAGARTYVNTSLWVRGAAGLGVFNGQAVQLDNGMIGDVTRIGPAALFGIGVDVARLKWTVVSLDASLTAMANRDGVLLSSGAHVGLSFD